MFKKPFADLKTIAPLRTSHRRKLKQRVLESYKELQPDDGDVLVPEGLHWQKFTTYSEEPGVAYFSMEGDPLWFTIGKDSDDLIPTVYTLWKRPNLLPFLSTTSAVVPKLINGADLMIPGVVQYPTSLVPDQLVSITQYHTGKLGFPIAVGRMAVSMETLQRAEDANVKGKAVYVLHTWRDALWETGTEKAADVPEPRMLGDGSAATADVLEGTQGEAANASEQTVETQGDEQSTAGGSSGPAATTQSAQAVLTSEDVSHALRSALLQALSTTLHKLPLSSFPMPASTFWSSYVLPARPTQVVGANGLADGSAVDVKHSTHKSVKAFLKACAKEGLIKLKDAKGGDVVVTAVFPKHPAVAEHRPVQTVKDVETKQQKAADRERQEREAEEKLKGQIRITESLRPFQNTVAWFAAAEKDTSELYTLNELKTIFNTYVSAKNLINAQDQQYINVGEDDILLTAIRKKGEIDLEFLKREEVLARLKDHMQSWYEIRVEGRDVVRKKGKLKPIQIVVKVRQGRKACTLVTGFEPYSLDADDLAEELRRVCASSTSVSSVHGKSVDMEIMVQGKQTKAVTDLLMAKGVPKKWIESVDMTAEKKKKK
ncbi:eukaryotic translation initiation factor SUI1 family protein [Laetiporus sulphureus 93-53]|uniref:Eukaryotic translation initiation factor SUI1 family protein n=1 Tax=Laetiporus sulphureus 93-53 TaxID=1314785 RepID=A0A165DNH6_9APHY|nr:eukaryotic translation initiation factor SUI1 family protein [Laetiporus sulphureus 93-53]KZT05270.1 eukaryotic translation initiation factor SUI1 family protein [Laetiporus sulphureus 93-53]